MTMTTEEQNEYLASLGIAVNDSSEQGKMNALDSLAADCIADGKFIQAISHAKNSGSPSAINNIATIVLNVLERSERDDAIAIKLLEINVARGNLLATHNLGQCYLFGIGTEVDEAKGFELTLKAARGGIYAAMESVAELFAHGKGCAPDLMEALFWRELLLTCRSDSLLPKQDQVFQSPDDVRHHISEQGKNKTWH